MSDSYKPPCYNVANLVVFKVSPHLRKNILQKSWGEKTYTIPLLCSEVSFQKYILQKHCNKYL